MPARARRRQPAQVLPVKPPERVHLRVVPAIVAAAQAIAKKITKPEKKVTEDNDWQTDVWRFYDLVGELHFGLQWKAAAVSRVKIVVAKKPVGGGDPEVLEVTDGTIGADVTAAQIASTLAGGAEGQSDLLRSAALIIGGVGEAYLVIDAMDDEVCSYSPSDVKVSQGIWTVSDEELDPEDLVIHVRKPHPAMHKRVDSPIKAALPVLRELWGLNQQLLGAVDSRLAGAGLLIVPQSISAPPPPPTDEDESDLPDDAETEGEQDPLLVALIEAMVTPIQDRESAAAVVPLLLRIPDEAAGKVQHLRFDVPFDPELRSLRDEAIRRLSLALDAPPEVLTGQGDVNHWSAWAIDESAVKLWVVPEAKVILKALTKKWFWPALEEAGLSPDAARDYLLWPDSSELEQRADKSANTIQAYDRGEASGEALRREIGLEETDAPDEEELNRMIELRSRLAQAQVHVTESTPAPADPGVDITRSIPDVPQAGAA